VELEELRRLACEINELVLERPAGLEEREPGSLCERSYAAVPESSGRHSQSEGERGGGGEHLRGCGDSQARRSASSEIAQISVEQL